MRDDDQNTDPLADLLSIVSHDIKNGLNVINLGAHQLSSMKSVDPDTAARLKRIADMLTRASRRMGDLMRDVVDLARIDTQSLAIESRTFRLNDAIKTAIDGHMREAEEKKISIDLSIDADLFALGDAERIGNVVSILLSNAIRVSPENSRVAVVAFVRDQHVRLEVRDLGPGIAESDLAALFLRPKPRRGQKRSLGRGLPLARGVIVAQGGTLEVESKEGEGSSFIVTLPIATP
jgi:two-component system, chemotaxis family, sensor kinase Cph1